MTSLSSQHHPPSVTTAQHHMFVVELVGLAGVGKTTLTTALLAAAPTVLGSWQLRQQLPLSQLNLAWHALMLTFYFMPTYLRHWPRHRWFTATEMRSLCYLAAWPRALAERKGQDVVQLMDLGPIFRLVFLTEFGTSLTQSDQFNAWRHRQITQWRELINVIIMLDAPDEVLQERIDGREKAHVAKAQSITQNLAFYQRYRAGYQEVIANLCRSQENGRAPMLLHFDTSQSSVDEIVTELLKTLKICTLDLIQEKS